MTDLRQRENIFELGDAWADPVLWYARGVKAMKARSLRDVTSWNFFGAIHGIWRALWDHYGITDSSDEDPSPADAATYVNQCQHQTWYFLPWHRGYLLALENVIRREIERQGGPHETWALPYWNYFAGQNVLPPAFRSANWPDGGGDNPLFVEQRWGPLAGNTPFDVASVTNLDSLDERQFVGPAGGGSAGFGGPQSGFNHGGGTNGALEMDPHNIVHGLVGGGSPTQTFPNGRPLPGLMSDPRTAALDPIFYVHHCNIDRLWESWNKFPVGKPSSGPTDWRNPTSAQWLLGPASIGEREFAMPTPDGSNWVYVPEQMQDISELGYEYDELSPDAVRAPAPRAVRTANLGVDAPAAAAGGLMMASQNKVELIGASTEGVSLAGAGRVRSSVRTEEQARARATASRRSVARAPSLPDRVFLNLENVTGVDDSTIFQVYVGLPNGADPAVNKDYLAGSVALFGVSQASDPDGDHAGNGITYTLEITKVVDKLDVDRGFDVDELSVDIVPLRDIPEAAEVKIGRISLFRQYE